MKYKFTKDYQDDMDLDFVFKCGDVLEVRMLNESPAVFCDGSWVFDVYCETGIKHGELIND